MFEKYLYYTCSELRIVTKRLHSNKYALERNVNKLFCILKYTLMCFGENIYDLQLKKNC